MKLGGVKGYRDAADRGGFDKGAMKKSVEGNLHVDNVISMAFNQPVATVVEEVAEGVQTANPVGASDTLSA